MAGVPRGRGVWVWGIEEGSWRLASGRLRSGVERRSVRGGVGLRVLG